MLYAPFRYIGGKSFMRGHIIKLMPPHESYVEPFFGAGSVYFGKNPSPVEVINDKDEEIITFFRVLQNPETFEKIMHRLEHTPYHKLEFERAWDMYLNKSWADDVERAWCFFVRARMSYGGRLLTKGFARLWKSSNQLQTAVDRLQPIHKRLKNATILCEDALRLLKIVPDEPDVLMYIDPPYVLSTRTTTEYQHEMTDEQHRELVDRLLQFKQTKIIVSGYGHETYNRLNENGWSLKTLDVPAYSIPVSGRNRGMKRARRLEHIWWNY